MARVKRCQTSHARHKKILAQAEGYYGARSRCFRVAKQAVIKAGTYAYRDRRQRKRDFRSLWIVRISAACKEHGLSYSKFIHYLKQVNIQINRKMLAEISVRDKEAFRAIIHPALPTST